MSTTPSHDIEPLKLASFGSEPSELSVSVQKEVNRVLASGEFILGKNVARFEQSFSEFCGVNHFVGLANGLDAIELGIRSLGLRPGDEVITSSVTAFATVLGILRSGATPILADIDAETGLLSIESAQRCLSAKTRAVLVVHLYGQVRSISEWATFCSEHSLFLIEDCAQSHGARSDGSHCGSFGEFGAFSFYPTKNLGSYGDAGGLLTENLELSQTVRTLANYGQVGRYVHERIGSNSRLDEIQAAILDARLSWLGDFTERRRRIAGKFFENIANPDVSLLRRPISPENHVFHQFVVRVKDRESFRGFLSGQGVPSDVHYPIPIHHQEAAREIKGDPDGLLGSELFTKECVSLPCQPGLAESQVDKIVDVVNSYRAV